MTDVIAVRFRNNPRQLWFDPRDVRPVEGDHVIVQTERGTEIGLACTSVFTPEAGAVEKLPSPLKPVLRIATDEDLMKAEELSRKGEEALPRFRELIENHGLDMKPVRVDFIFGGEKIVFYFASEERVDFRDLVRDLASAFHARVDMRQIGVRDEARMVGGLAHCGQELCCARLGGDFQPVSIRMAKEQDLPLNPLKISGLCGRLMCCLRYEFEAYKDFKSRAPKNGAILETPLGLAKVVEFDTPREVISLRLEDGKMLHIPLSGMECDKQPDGGCGRPCRVTAAAIEAASAGSLDLSPVLGTLDRNLEDGVVSDGTAPRKPRRRKAVSTGDAPQGNPARGGQGRQAPSGPSQTDKETPSKPRRRRHRGHGGGESDVAEAAKPQGGAQGAQTGQKAARRPGQNSSGLRNGTSPKGQTSSAPSARTTQPRQSGGAESPQRRQPRRRHPSGESGSQDAGGRQ